MRVAIIDDVQHELDVTCALVQAHDNSAHMSTFSSGSDFLAQHLHSIPFDVILLDIEMPGLDGMETARKIREIDEEVIIVFTTRMAQYAVAGYEVDAASYLVKPISERSFALAWHKVIRILHSRKGASIAVDTTDGTVYLSTSEINYIEVRSHMSYYHTTHGVYRAWKSLSAVFRDLKNFDFIEVSRFAIVNMAKVSRFDAAEGDIDIQGDMVHVSRSKKHDVAQSLLDFHARA
ncbi:LytR/AlgR family response regulator transcription factor [Alloscardovia venturai]|uniref:LytR/AlgR family response regulator transcription factor n=1 Tax=Alloscardovia venturai TaxID=1769421 RepID=A0ABW2Y5G0_9BIFI